MEHLLNFNKNKRNALKKQFFKNNFKYFKKIAY